MIAGKGLLALATAGVVIVPLGLSQAAPSSKLVSKSSAGVPASAHSDVAQATAISGDGRFVVFSSAAANLPGGNGSTQQVYVRDVQTGKTRLASKGNDGDPAESPVGDGAISANGRYVGFSGTGAGLPGATAHSQVWVHDRKRGKTILVSRAANGAPANLHASSPSLSAKGRAVSFDSTATNLPGGGLERRVFVRDLDRRKTILASRESAGNPASGSLYGQSISSDGRRVVFYSDDPELPGSGTHAYMRDLDRGKTFVADRNSAGAIGDSHGYNPSISGNGRFVIFETQATNFPGAGPSSNQVYVRDLKRGKTRLAGRTNSGDPQDGYAEFAHLSGSGRYAQFVSSATNLPGAGATQTYVRDLRRGKTKLVSRAANGDPADQAAQNGSISLDGRWAVFESFADNLGGDPTVQQVFRAGWN